MTRGILACAYAKLRKKTDVSRIRALFEKEYGGERFIRLLPEGRWPQTKDVSYTNYVDINAAVDERNGRVIVLAALDNLVKGASGQAVQNMNLMFGLDEAAGLV
jgi:N-acetyl-gamma-glutamyl-phosphate reductase